MMRRLSLCLPLLLCIAVLTGCASNIQKDYGQYLQNNAGDLRLPPIDRPFGYSVSPATRQHSTRVRSWKAGIANSWEVRFSDILETTLNSADVHRAIRLHPVSAEDVDKIVFHLLRYEFSDHRASIDLHIDTYLASGATLSHTYRAEGLSQAGKMFWGGAFAMKNAMQQSSKHAMDQILLAYFTDLASAIYEDATVKSVQTP